MQPMKESIVTILHGIKAWGDASISRLREDLQRQIPGGAADGQLRQSNLLIMLISASGSYGMAWMGRMSGFRSWRHALMRN